MGDQLWKAAAIALVGVAVVMIALAILMLAIMVLNRLAPHRNRKESPGIGTPAGRQEDQPSRQSVAAMAVGVALAMESQKECDGHGRAEVPASRHITSRWSAAGREQLMGSRNKTRRRWGRLSS